MTAPPRLRRAARALILDPLNSVLLVCFPTDSGNYWATPGGGLDPGESMLDGLRRELWEEIGRNDLEIGPLLWTRTSWFSVSDEFDGQYNEIYLVRSDRFTPEPEIGWEQMRAEGVSDIRWWSLDEIEAAPHTEMFVPADLAPLTRELLANGPPSRGRSLNATSFGLDTTAYDTGRPGYPTEAVAWATQPLTPGSKVIDIGAGTGKLTAGLVELGFRVCAVDPDAQMLATLNEHMAGVDTLQASAEHVPLPSHSVEGALFGQSWHWVDVDAASAEVGRVLRPGGVLGLVWNIRDESVAWARELGDIMHQSPAERMVESDAVRVGEPFGTLERHSVSWTRPMRRDEIMSMVRSRSYYLTANPRTRAATDTGVTELLDRLGVTGKATIDVPYVTHVFRAVAAQT